MVYLPDAWLDYELRCGRQYEMQSYGKHVLRDEVFWLALMCWKDEVQSRSDKKEVADIQCKDALPGGQPFLVYPLLAMLAGELQCNLYCRIRCSFASQTVNLPLQLRSHELENNRAGSIILRDLVSFLLLVTIPFFAVIFNAHLA